MKLLWFIFLTLKNVLILCKEEYGKAIDKALFPGTQGGPLMHGIAAKAVCFGEALKDSFKEYQKQVVLNAKILLPHKTHTGGTVKA